MPPKPSSFYSISPITTQMSQEFAYRSTVSLRLEDLRGRFTPWRPPIRLSGRGGAGNVHTTITPNVHTSSSASDSTSTDYSSSSSSSSRTPRFLSLPHTGNTKPRSKSCPRTKATSFGRGGAGNRRERRAANTSNRSSTLPDITRLDQQYLLARDAWRPHQPQSSGRGGAGNIRLPRPVARAVEIFVSVTKR